eukprot:scaffold12698_cov57-Attheya_sp.AAC.4
MAPDGAPPPIMVPSSYIHLPNRNIFNGTSRDSSMGNLRGKNGEDGELHLVGNNLVDNEGNVRSSPCLKNHKKICTGAYVSTPTSYANELRIWSGVRGLSSVAFRTHSTQGSLPRHIRVVYLCTSTWTSIYSILIPP